ncbi:magnesium chelatase ATPase subunit I [Romboutsia maritimum]|uniref:Mg-protoporphyrin IX chelatase n=1 Tax=Romboutsia maritimum TaxID=2020948 RepID=A0A371IX34_9FIRM|nr:ATP-binding protein [Romboutsia maritimum]RDY25027.1 magnesium chelatase ATPase subunit I [Romboutsia maritimum]
MSKKLYPFSAIIGQESMKKGLILNIINPKISGILVFGEKGTAKSTTVRAIPNLLPEIDVVKGCRFNCNPHDKSTMCSDCLEKVNKGEKIEIVKQKMKVVDLPVSATEDRVVGSLDIEEAIKSGTKKFEPGVLAQANRGILYVDEINLLDDHIVDLLLDSAAMGVNTVEREGISFSHPANFILVGTMNPEEGELRPQLLDRFGFSVDIKGIKDPQKRVQIVKYRSEFEENQDEFISRWEEEEQELRDKIENARKIINEVEISDEMLFLNAQLSIALEIDGHRGDLTLMKATKSMAAFNNRKLVQKEDIEEVARMVLLHRMRSLPFESAKKLDQETIKKIINAPIEMEI